MSNLYQRNGFNVCKEMVREQPHLGKEKKRIVLVSVQCVKEVEEGAEDAALGCPDVERQTDGEV